MKTIELLAPAKNLATGIEAIKHGADAVYIGGPNFGARSAAGNSVEDIQSLCRYAHFYGAKVYVTLNTILYDDELNEAQQLIYQLHDAGVDAIIVQDLALCRLSLPPIELHASTQLDITTPEKAQMLEQAGFKQIVLARELSLNQIKQIHNATPIALEAFIHGALCVSYSGRCYASEYCFKRSANRGQCAQFCRLPFTLKDADGRIIRKNKHLLSLRDMNRSASFEAMIDAGIRSFKIEGRLKDVNYVKNVTAFYRNLIDTIISKRPNELQRASYGASKFTFTPQLNKSFNRKFTEYFINGHRHAEANIDTPKSMGEKIGRINRTEGNRLEVTLHEGVKLQAGDGLCFIDYEGTLYGFRANTISATPRRNTFIVTLFGTPQFTVLPKHTITLYRNSDQEFEKLLSRESATRKLLLQLTLSETPNGFSLIGEDEMGRTATVSIDSPHQPAMTPQRENILRQLLKVGDSPYIIENINIQFSNDWFIPSSILAGARRDVIQQLLTSVPQNTFNVQRSTFNVTTSKPLNLKTARLDYTANISNAEAKQFYTNLGVMACDKAFELEQPKGRKAIMFCKYCIRHELGLCKKSPTPTAQRYNEPLTLHSADGKQFELSFNCKDCEMTILTKDE